MYVVLLKFSDNRKQAPEFMDGHNSWLQQGFADGVFVAAGSLQPAQGGAIVAHATSLDELRRRVDLDPFVANNVVSAEVLDIALAMTDERLDFLKD